MLVDGSGNVVVTNDGVTILENIEAGHPAARMAMNLARGQKEGAGDGTTTATLFLAAMVEKGTEAILKGVPVSKVLEGIRDAVRFALGAYTDLARRIDPGDAQAMMAVATVAGRGMTDIASLVVEAAGIIGVSRLCGPGFRFADRVMPMDAGPCETLEGIVIDKPPISEGMPGVIENPRILIIEDALDYPRLDYPHASGAALARQERLLGEHKALLEGMVEWGVGLILLDRGASDEALDTMLRHGILGVRRVSGAEMSRAAEYTGAKPVRLSTMRLPSFDPDSVLGGAKLARVDKSSGTVRLVGGHGLPDATIIVTGPTRDLAEETERIARDAASAVQGAVATGVVPGGGATEIAVARAVAKARASVRGMASYGWEVVQEALRRPVAQMILNSGFNPLEKLEDASAAQELSGSAALAMDFDTGAVVDMGDAGVLDPLNVRRHALSTAGMVAAAVLRISSIVKMKEPGMSLPDPVRDFE